MFWKGISILLIPIIAMIVFYGVAGGTTNVLAILITLLTLCVVVWVIVAAKGEDKFHQR